MYFWKYILAKKAGLSQKKCNMALYGLPVLPIAEAFEKTVTGNPISITDALAQDALSLQVSFTPTQDGTPSIDSEPETSPYLSKVIPRGNKEYYSLVGATVAWNQLVHGDFGSDYATYWIVYSGTGSINDGVLTVTGAVGRSGIKAQTGYGLPSSVAGHYLLFSVDYKSTVDLQGYAGATFDLPASSDFVRYVKFKKSVANPSAARLSLDFFPNTAGEIGTFSFANFQITDLTLMFANAPAIADYAYTLEQSEAGSGIAWLKSYGFFTKDYYPYNAGELISVNTSGHKIGSTTYPIDPTDLRGLFKMSNGKLYCEGDIYPPSGGMERKFEYRAYQSGDESLTDAITDGTHTVVKLATPTTESATPYASPATVEAGGTEEFIDNRTVPIPVGNETYYASEYEIHGKTGVTVSHGATADDPNPTEYEVEFTQQGTVYGGTVDIVSGVLTVTWTILSNPQNLNWITNSSQGMKNFQTERGTVSKKSGSNNWKCSRYSNGFIGTDKTEGIFIFDSGEVCIRDYRYWEHGGTSAEEAAFKASLADVTIAYELATPLTYQLTTQQVQMLLNDNYLETSDGMITLTYMAGR